MAISNTDDLTEYKILNVSDNTKIEETASEEADVDTDKFWNKFKESIESLQVNSSTFIQSDYDEKISEIISTLETNPFEKYSNNKSENSWLTRYEDIVGINSKDSSNVQLDDNTSIDDFIDTCDHISNFEKVDDFEGAFLFPSLNAIQNIQTDGGERDSIILKPGETISVPITFEFFLSSSDNITKSLLFDIKPSISKDDVHYHIEVTAHNDINSSAQIYTIVDTVLQDETTVDN